MTFLKKEKSPVVKKKMISRASKVTESEVEKQRLNRAISPRDKKVVKTIGLGRRRSKLDQDALSDQISIDSTVSRSRSVASTKSMTSKGNSVGKVDDDKDWEIVDSTCPPLSSPKRVKFSTDGKEEEQEEKTKVAKESSESNDESNDECNDESNDDENNEDSLLDKAADVADRTLLFIGAQMHKAVVHTKSALTSKD